jgi:hypothetical protein
MMSLLEAPLAHFGSLPRELVRVCHGVPGARPDIDHYPVIADVQLKQTH